jgi:ribonuclease E
MSDADQTPPGSPASSEATTPRPERPPTAGATTDTTPTTRSSGDAPSSPSGDGSGPSGSSGSSGSSEDGARSGSGRRRRGSRGGRGRGGAGGESASDRDGGGRPDGRGDGGRSEAGGRGGRPDAGDGAGGRSEAGGGRSDGRGDGDRPASGGGDGSAAAKPKIGDTRPAPAPTAGDGPDGGRAGADGEGSGEAGGGTRKRRRRGGRGRGKGGGGQSGQNGGGQNGGQSGGGQNGGGQNGSGGGGGGRQGQGGGQGGQGGGRGKGRGPKPVQPVTAVTGEAVELDDDVIAARKGRERKGKAVGRYLMAVHVQPEATQIAILEGRSLIEHQVSRPADDISQIHGNIYLGKVQNVLPGMEAAFVDIGTPKNAVLYRSDARADDDLDQPNQKKNQNAKIEDMLRAKQLILCQVTKNPIAHKGARLTQEVSLPGRFVVLVPNSTTYGISKRLPDDERKRLRGILDKVRPKGHGLIVRTAAEGVTASEIEADVARLAKQWEQIEALAAKARNQGASLLYREPDTAIRMIREELTNDFRKVVIDDRGLYEEVLDYVSSISPEMAERVEHFDPAAEPLPLFEKHHIHEQLHKALDRKVWLPSGGSLIIEHTEALTVIDVNTGKNVGKSSLEQTVFANNLEAAEEVARQLRLRDIGGIIVIDFIDMEVAKNRDEVIKTFRDALARDKTRTQVFDISQLGLVEMTRKRIGEGLLESFASGCPHCDGRGVVIDTDLLPKG